MAIPRRLTTGAPPQDYILSVGLSSQECQECKLTSPDVLNEVSASDQVDEEACERLCRAIFPRYRFEGQPDRTRPVRTEQMLQQMRNLVDRHKAIDYASLLRRCIDRAVSYRPVPWSELMSPARSDG